jgi:hypothetical protein
MGLNPYFNESRSNLDYHEVQARSENNSNVYERSTAHWYALANARSIGKPITYAADAHIFKTSHPGQLRLPTYVDPLAHKWTNTHYTNEAIVGHDNIEGAKLNYEDWHQGVGLVSRADEKFLIDFRTVQKTGRIENLQALRAGETIPDIRRYQNVKSAQAIISKLKELKDDLTDETYLPKNDEKPTEIQKKNIETFKNSIKDVNSAIIGLNAVEPSTQDSINNAVRRLLGAASIGPTAQRTQSVGSALQQLSSSIGAFPVNVSQASQRMPDAGTFSTTSTTSLSPGSALQQLNESIPEAPVQEAPAPEVPAPTPASAPAPPAPAPAPVESTPTTINPSDAATSAPAAPPEPTQAPSAPVAAAPMAKSMVKF